MAILDDILAKVYTITNRPDLDVETTQVVSRALNYCHFGRPGLQNPNSDFSFDLVEGQNAISIDANTGTESLNFTIALPNRFRKFKYLYCDPPVNPRLSFGTGNKALTLVPPSALFERSSLMRQSDCYYVAGTNVVIRTSQPRKTLYWGFFQLPSLADSFIANNFSDAIAWKAAAELFAMLDDTKKTYYEQLVIGQLVELQASYLDF